MTFLLSMAIHLASVGVLNELDGGNPELTALTPDDVTARPGIVIRITGVADLESWPRGLRHTHAHELMMEGVPVPIIQQQLGHSSLATTDRYVSHLAPMELIQRMKLRAWKGT